MDGAEDRWGDEGVEGGGLGEEVEAAGFEAVFFCFGEFGGEFFVCEGGCELSVHRWHIVIGDGKGGVGWDAKGRRCGRQTFRDGWDSFIDCDFELQVIEAVPEVEDFALELVERLGVAGTIVGVLKEFVFHITRRKGLLVQIDALRSLFRGCHDVRSRRLESREAVPDIFSEWFRIDDRLSASEAGSLLLSCSYLGPSLDEGGGKE